MILLEPVAKWLIFIDFTSVFLMDAFDLMAWFTFTSLFSMSFWKIIVPGAGILLTDFQFWNLNPKLLPEKALLIINLTLLISLSI